MRLFDEVYLFAELFDGSREAVGLEKGGCERLADPADWDMYVEGHLLGANPPIGVYPMFWTDDCGWEVKWGCVDFDEGEERSWLYAQDLYNCLAQFGVKSWIERSRSKGYHVWIFLEHWTEADIVRRALLAACQIVSVPAKEVNPKQSELAEGQLGNYVRLPYPGWYTEAGPDWEPKRVMVRTDTRSHMGLAEFLDVAASTRVSQHDLMVLAGYYIPPQVAQLKRAWGDLLQGGTRDRLRGKARIIWEQGPLEHPDSDTNYRGHTLWKLARLLHEDGQHTPEEALELLRDADARWGKFHERPDGEKYLREMTYKAFGLGVIAGTE